MPSPENKTSRGFDRIWFLLPWFGLLAGTLMVGSAFRHSSAPGSIAPVARFWIGLAFVYIPAFWRIVSMSAARGERAALLVVIAVFSLLPRMLTCPDYFCSYDELGWWRAVQNLEAGSELLAPAPLGAAQGAYPALPVVTGMLQETGGLSTFQTGLILAVIFRIVTLLGVFVLGERTFLSTRAGASAALVVFLYPGFYQATGFTSDRMGLVLLVMGLLVAGYVAEREDQERTPAWFVLALLLLLTGTITHPSTGYMLSWILACMAISASFPSPGSDRTAALRLGKLAALAFLVSTTWLLATSPELLSDKLEWLRSSWTRWQMTGSLLPIGTWQPPFLLAIVGLAVFLTILGARLIRRLGLPVLPAANGLLLGGMSALAFIGILRLTGETALPSIHTGLFIAAALLVGLVIAWITAPKRHGEPAVIRATRQFVPLAVLMAVLVGITVPNTTAWQALDQTRFKPSFTRENVEAAEWMLSQAGPGNRILGDEASLRVFGSLGMQDPVSKADLRAWNVLSSVSNPLQTLLWLTVSDASYLVLDSRQNDILDLSARQPIPVAGKRTSNAPVTFQAPSKQMDTAPLLARVYDSGQVRIYYLPLGSTPHQGKSLLPGVKMEEPAQPAIPNRSSLLPLPAWPALLVLMFLPGYLLSAVLFPKRKDIDDLTRVLLAVAGSISLLALLGSIAGLLIPGSTGAIELVWIAIIFLAALSLQVQGGEGFRDWLRAHSFLRIRLGRATLSAVIMATCCTLFALMLMTRATPAAAPITQFSLDLTSPIRVQIANNEGHPAEYEVAAQVDGMPVWSSGLVQVQAGQIITLDMSGELPESTRGTRVDLLLYLRGNPDVYRSLHLTMPAPQEQTNALEPAIPITGH